MTDILPTFILDWISAFNSYADSYPMVAGAISLWFLGVGSFVSRRLPSNIFSFLKKHLTVEVSVLSSCRTFHQLIVFFGEKGMFDNVRSLKFYNGVFDDENMIKSLGYGNHIVWYGIIPIRITLARQETRTNHELDLLQMKVFGRSHNIFNKIIEAAIEDDKKITVKKYQSGWYGATKILPTNIHNICLGYNVVDSVVLAIRDFKEKRDWYLEKGVPYQLGIMLYGPPGTGKTSLIRAIASEFKLDIYQLSSSKLFGVESAFSALPKNSLVVIEDIDSEISTHCRSKAKNNLSNGHNQPQQCRPDSTSFEDSLLFNFTNLSDILDAIDGICSADGRILFMTTNHIEKLDQALIRPGRIDFTFELGYADEEILQRMIAKFYPGQRIGDGFKIKPETSPAEIQQLILQNLDNPTAVLEKLCPRV